jgi:voltage-gated potassium channel
MAPWFRLFAGTVLLVTVYFAVPLRADGNLVSRLVLTLIALALSVFLIAREIRKAPQAPLWSLALALVTGLLTFALADYLIAISAPGEFVQLSTRLDALYFAVTTLATVGFGDVHAQSQFARAAVTIQMVFNIVVIASGGRILLTQARERRSAPK